MPWLVLSHLVVLSRLGLFGVLGSLGLDVVVA